MMIMMKAVMKVFLLVWAVGAPVVSTTEDSDDSPNYEHWPDFNGTEATSISYDYDYNYDYIGDHIFGTYLEDSAVQLSGPSLWLALTSGLLGTGAHLLVL